MFTPPEYLSPSSIGLFRDCPQKFKLSYIDKIKEPPAWHLYLGSFVHEVLEYLYKEDAENRTHETLKSIAHCSNIGSHMRMDTMLANATRPSKRISREFIPVP